MKERLQKILARAGYGSRRKVEAIISGRRVRVNGALARLGDQADAGADAISVDGRRVETPAHHVYLLMYKPAGFVTTLSDPQRRATVASLLPAGTSRAVVPVGRLDADTDGVLLFTDDGELAHRLTHPRWEVEKEYAALVDGVPGRRALQALRRGVEVGGRLTKPAQVEVMEAGPRGYATEDGQAWLRIVIHEGRKRQVRLMCAAVGHPVRTLVRTRVGPQRLGRMRRGSVRMLSPTEVESLRSCVGL